MFALPTQVFIWIPFQTAALGPSSGSGRLLIGRHVMEGKPQLTCDALFLKKKTKQNTFSCETVPPRASFSSNVQITYLVIYCFCLIYIFKSIFALTDRKGENDEISNLKVRVQSASFITC